MFLEVALKEELSDAYLDQLIPFQLKYAFVATTTKDANLLTEAMKQNGWRCKVVCTLIAVPNNRHALSAQELAARGVKGYLDDAVICSAPSVRSVLREYANLHRIAYTDIEKDFGADGMAKQHDDRRGLRAVFTPSNFYSVKFSKYGPYESSISTSCIFPSSGLFKTIAQGEQLERTEVELQAQKQRLLEQRVQERLAMERAFEQREIEQKAAKLRAAEQRAAEQRAAEVVIAEKKIAEQTAAEAERKRTCEMQSASAAGKGFTEAESRARAAEASAWMASQRARATEIRAQVAEMRAQEAEGRAWSAETNARSFNERATAAEERARLAEVKLIDAEGQEKAAEQRAQVAEQRIEAATKASEEAGEKAVKYAADAHERLLMVERAIVKLKCHALDLRRDVESAQNLASAAREKQLEAEDQTAKWIRESSGQAGARDQRTARADGRIAERGGCGEDGGFHPPYCCVHF
jgi:uncharacterized protein YwgA